MARAARRRGIPATAAGAIREYRVEVTRALARWPAPAFALSAALFALTLRVLLSWPEAVGLTAFVMVHELGHVAAMRAYGVRVWWVVFLPFVGGVTAHDGYPAGHARMRMAVASAGLLAGMAVVPPLLLVGEGRAAAWAVGLTALNLLPLRRLDGEHIHRWVSGLRSYRRVARGALLLWATAGLVALFAA